MTEVWFCGKPLRDYEPCDIRKALPVVYQRKIVCDFLAALVSTKEGISVGRAMQAYRRKL